MTRRFHCTQHTSLSVRLPNHLQWSFGGTSHRMGYDEAQFYPALRGRIPKEALGKALKDHDIR